MKSGYKSSIKEVIIYITCAMKKRSIAAPCAKVGNV